MTFSWAAGTIVRGREREKKKSFADSRRSKIFNKDLIDATCVFHVDREEENEHISRLGERERKKKKKL